MPPELCDAACQKIIINSRLIAPISDHLAETLGDRSQWYRAAKGLATAARALVAAHSNAVAYGTLKLVSGDVEWDGCEDALRLTGWVQLAENGKPLPSNAGTIMQEMARVANARTRKLVSPSANAEAHV